MRQKSPIPFHITGIDSLGQGVSKLTDKVTFIPKTVIGDKGQAIVMAEKKGVAFAKIQSLSEEGTKRINPACVHFASCPSCHYLHMDYEEELKFKKEAFEKLFRKLPLQNFEVVGAPKRLHYRNRIQLHYSLKSKLLGMRDPRTFEIIPISQCLVGVEKVTQELKRLYENQQWMKEAPAAPTEGHVEIYWFKNELKTSWNRPYAEGGFTQVYEEMNEKLKTILGENCTPAPEGDLLDLFGGNGNLSEKLPFKKRLCVDLYPKSPVEDSFFSQDLYHDQALKNVIKECQKKNLKIGQLLLDPPRSGLKNLSQWAEAFKPQTITYVSCDPHTLVRDLEALEGYELKMAKMIDFFPSTFHFESLVFLERKSG